MVPEGGIRVLREEGTLCSGRVDSSPGTLSTGAWGQNPRVHLKQEDRTEGWEVEGAGRHHFQTERCYMTRPPRDPGLPVTTSCAICIKSFSFFGPAFSP